MKKDVKKIKARIDWLIWRLTGYRELTQLLRSHAGNYGALTPIGLERMKELGEKESEIVRRLKSLPQ